MSSDATKAAVAGVAGAAGTAGTLGAMSTSVGYPTSNLAGYVVAGRILGGGAITSAKVAAVGGPVVAAGLASAGIGLAVAAVAYGIFKLLR